MPCYSIRTYSVDFQKSPDFELLAKAAKAIGGTSIWVNARLKELTFWHSGAAVSVRDGKLTTQEGREGVAAQLTTAYTKEVVRLAAKRFDLAYTETAQDQAVLQWRY